MQKVRPTAADCGMPPLQGSLPGPYQGKEAQKMRRVILLLAVLWLVRFATSSATHAHRSYHPQLTCIGWE